MEPEHRVPIRSEADIVGARRTGRDLGESIGFSVAQLALIATAISEVARNIVTYAGSGEVLVRTVNSGARTGIEVVASDHGPGIADIERAMQDGWSSGQGLGLGLPGAKRLMDEFQIDSRPGDGTTIVMRKWLP